MSDPKEWWITFGTHTTLVQTYPPMADQIIKAIHVIEYSAYESVCESLVLAKKQRDEFEYALLEARQETERTQKAHECTLKACEKAFEEIEALTFSWVIAEQTINCKHTYDSIKRVASETLAKIKQRSEG